MQALQKPSTIHYFECALPNFATPSHPTLSSLTLTSCRFLGSPLAFFPFGFQITVTFNRSALSLCYVNDNLYRDLTDTVNSILRTRMILQIYRDHVSAKLSETNLNFLNKQTIKLTEIAFSDENVCVCIFADYSFVFKTLCNDKNEL